MRRMNENDRSGRREMDQAQCNEYLHRPLSVGRDRTPSHRRGRTTSRPRNGHGRPTWVDSRSTPSCCARHGTACAESSGRPTNEELSSSGRHGDCTIDCATRTRNATTNSTVDVSSSRRRTWLRRCRRIM